LKNGKNREKIPEKQVPVGPLSKCGFGMKIETVFSFFLGNLQMWLALKGKYRLVSYTIPISLTIPAILNRIMIYSWRSS